MLIQTQLLLDIEHGMLNALEQQNYTHPGNREVTVALTQARYRVNNLRQLLNNGQFQIDTMQIYGQQVPTYVMDALYRSGLLQQPQQQIAQQPMNAYQQQVPQPMVTNYGSPIYNYQQTNTTVTTNSNSGDRFSRYTNNVQNISQTTTTNLNHYQPVQPPIAQEPIPTKPIEEDIEPICAPGISFIQEDGIFTFSGHDNRSIAELEDINTDGVLKYYETICDIMADVKMHQDTSILSAYDITKEFVLSKDDITLLEQYNNDNDKAINGSATLLELKRRVIDIPVSEIKETYDNFITGYINTTLKENYGSNIEIDSFIEDADGLEQACYKSDKHSLNVARVALVESIKYMLTKGLKLKRKRDNEEMLDYEVVKLSIPTYVKSIVDKEAINILTKHTKNTIVTSASYPWLYNQIKNAFSKIDSSILRLKLLLPSDKTLLVYKTIDVNKYNIKITK